MDQGWDDESIEPKAEKSGLGVRIGLAAAVGLGALASGLLLTRGGRRLVADVFGGRRRSAVESRVLDVLWNDRVLGRRRIDVAEIEPGRVVLRGRVGSRDEVGRAIAVAERAKGVREVREELQVMERS
jgi:hypothetical protein